MLSSLIDFLDGKKTFLICACIFILCGMHGVGWVSDSLYNTLLPLLGAGGIAGLRASNLK